MNTPLEIVRIVHPGEIDTIDPIFHNRAPLTHELAKIIRKLIASGWANDSKMDIDAANEMISNHSGFTNETLAKRIVETPDENTRVRGLHTLILEARKQGESSLDDPLAVVMFGLEKYGDRYPDKNIDRITRQLWRIAHKAIGVLPYPLTVQIFADYLKPDLAPDEKARVVREMASLALAHYSQVLGTDISHLSALVDTEDDVLPGVFKGLSRKVTNGKPSGLELGEVQRTFRRHSVRLPKSHSNRTLKN